MDKEQIIQRLKKAEVEEGLEIVAAVETAFNRQDVYDIAKAVLPYRIGKSETKTSLLEKLRHLYRARIKSRDFAAAAQDWI